MFNLQILVSFLLLQPLSSNCRFQGMYFFVLPVVLVNPGAQAWPTSIDDNRSAANPGSTVASASVSAIPLLVPPGSVTSGFDPLSSNSRHHLPLFRCNCEQSFETN